MRSPLERPKYGVRSVDDISKSSFRNYLILWISILQILLFHFAWDFRTCFFFNIFFLKEVNSKKERVESEEWISIKLGNS